MQDIGDSPLGYVVFVIAIFFFLKVVESVLSGGTDKVKDRYNDNKNVAIAIFLIIFTAIFFLFATPIAEFLGVDKDTILLISFITFIISILIFKFNK